MSRTQIIQQNELFLAAVVSGDAQKVREMIAHGAVVNALSQHGATPLHWAANSNHVEVLKVLLDHGAAIEAKAVDGCTPLHFACREDCVEAAEVLLQHGANAQARNVRGSLPMDVIYDEDEVPELLRLLAEHGGVHPPASQNGNGTVRASFSGGPTNGLTNGSATGPSNGSTSATRPPTEGMRYLSMSIPEDDIDDSIGVRFAYGSNFRGPGLQIGRSDEPDEGILFGYDGSSGTGGGSTEPEMVSHGTGMDVQVGTDEDGSSPTENGDAPRVTARFSGSATGMRYDALQTDAVAQQDVETDTVSVDHSDQVNVRAANGRVTASFGGGPSESVDMSVQIGEPLPSEITGTEYDEGEVVERHVRPDGRVEMAIGD
ncbi:hypothetical protein CYMTET_3830 [Cymbomonas tetramitiformis]|uniref:Uncharacterized protein n=1 Tax=Cymbomonas tetramitiformis TaxID=36881 RepID=A0AAE0H2A8_9CHLO|nr:hypothetical protein CYMTET_3830 [Cymbomonas tetramitiformis]